MLETQEIINQISVLSYSGIWLLSFAANVIVPIPEEIILLVLGYVAGGPGWNGLLLLLTIFTGVVASDVLIYYLARSGNRFVTGIYNTLFANKVENKKEWIEKHMNKVIFFSRFLIQLRFLGPFIAGQMKVPFKRFIFWDTLALLIYVPFYVTLGWYFRSSFSSIISGIGVLQNVFISLALIVVVLVLMRFLRKKYYNINHE